MAKPTQDAFKQANDSFDCAATVKAQKHVGIMDVHNTTSDFESPFRTMTYGERPVNPSIENSVTFFRAKGQKPEDQAAYFEAVHKTVGLDAVVLITGGCARPGDAEELAAAMKSLAPDVQVVMAYPLYALHEVIGREAAKNMEEKSRDHKAILVATNDRSIFTLQSYDESTPIEKQNVTLKMPENIDVLIASTEASKTFMEYLDLPGRNPNIPTDERQLSRLSFDLIDHYEEMPGIAEAIQVLDSLKYGGPGNEYS